MKSLQRIRQERLKLTEAIRTCPKECAGGVPGLYCDMCRIATEQEKLLAWVSDEKSIMEEFQEEQRKEYLADKA